MNTVILEIYLITTKSASNQDNVAISTGKDHQGVLNNDYDMLCLLTANC